MNQIEKARLEIDSVDKEIARLYEKTLRCSQRSIGV